MAERWVTVFILIFALTAITACNGYEEHDQTPEATATIEVEVLTGEAMIVADTAVVRAGPGTQFEQVDTLEKGMLVKLEGVTVDGRWYKIIAPGYNEPCWVAAAFITTEPVMESPEVEDDDQPAETNTPTPKPISTPTGLPTATYEPRFVNSPVPVPTPTPTPTAVSIPTIIPTPTASPTTTATEVPTLKPIDTPTNTPDVVYGSPTPPPLDTPSG